MSEEADSLRLEIESIEATITRYAALWEKAKSDISRLEARIESRAARISSLEAELAVAPPERAAHLHRRISALRGWQTRDRKDLAHAKRLAGLYFYYLHYHRVHRADLLTQLWLTQLRTLRDEAKAGVKKDRREEILAALASIEAAIPPLLDELRETRREAVKRNWKTRRPDYPTLLSWIQAAYGRLAAVKRLIAEIRRLLKPPREIIQSTIGIYSIAYSKDPSKRRYEKRFQCLYTVDAIRDTGTGEFTYTHPLTGAELKACIGDFLKRWNWSELIPRTVSQPQWAETGEWEPVDVPRGAFIEYLSVRQDGEELWDKSFIPPERIYTPSLEEKESMLREIGKTDEEIEQLLEEEK